MAGTRWALAGILLAAVMLTGCGQGAARVAEPEAAPSNSAATDARPLVIFVGFEVASVATRPFVQKGFGNRASLRMFNALLAVIDARGVPQPELLSSLPSLNTDSWQVFADGTMQTTYTLRPNLTWHDGQPLTSEDFVFSWRVYSSPELGLASQQPVRSMADVAAIDRERFVIHWKALYPEAETLSMFDREFPALPQHILRPAFDQMSTAGRDVFATLPFWAPKYVGLGPYRLQQWEAGSFIDTVRFEGYALGVPKIPRIRVRFSTDLNVVVANLLTGEAHVATDNAIGQSPETLRQECARTNAGTVVQSPTAWRHVAFQLRPDLANPRVILDPRVRKAIAHAVDKQAVNDAVYAGQMVVADTPVWTGSAWGAAVDNSIPRYPLDPRAAESLLAQAGLNKGADGFYAGADGRISLELVTGEDPDFVREILVLASGLQTAGLDIQQRVIPAALAQDAQLRSTFPALQVNSTGMGSALDILASTQIPSASNRWVGGNRGGWSSPEVDQLLTTFRTTLNPGDRVALVRQMLRIYSEELPSVSLFFHAPAFAHVAGLHGPARVAPESTVAWNIYEWEFN